MVYRIRLRRAWSSGLRAIPHTIWRGVCYDFPQDSPLSRLQIFRVTSVHHFAIIHKIGIKTLYLSQKCIAVLIAGGGVAFSWGVALGVPPASLASS